MREVWKDARRDAGMSGLQQMMVESADDGGFAVADRLDRHAVGGP